MIAAEVVILYARVSSAAQDVDLQIRMGMQHAIRLGYAEAQVITITDEGVSSQKIIASRRKGLTQVMTWVQSGRIRHVIVYDRDRLARSMPEYMTILNAFQTHNVSLEFSNRDVIPFSTNLSMEAHLASFAQAEGERIRKRVADSRPYYPRAPYGYRREGKSSSVHYVFEPEEIERVRCLFDEFMVIYRESDYRRFEKRWKTTLNRDVRSILSNSYYAATFYRSDQEIEVLRHLPPIIELEQILLNRKKFDEWYPKVSSVNEATALRRWGIPIYCTVCGRLLDQKNRKGEFVFWCTHRPLEKRSETLRVSAMHVQHAIEKVVKNLLNGLKITELKRLVMNSIYEKKYDLQMKRRHLHSELLDVRKCTVMYSNPAKVPELLKSYDLKQRAILNLEDMIKKLEILHDDVDFLIDGVKETMLADYEEHPSIIVRLLIYHVHLSTSEITIGYHFGEFYRGAME